MFMKKLYDMLEFLIPNYVLEGKNQLVITTSKLCPPLRLLFCLADTSSLILKVFFNNVKYFLATARFSVCI